MRKRLTKLAEDILYRTCQRGLTDAKKLGRALEAGGSSAEEFTVKRKSWGR